MRLIRFSVLVGSTIVIASSVSAAIVEIEALQVGGFYDGGTANNTPEFQNYFVGYGTTPGFPRTTERRSFFWFPLVEVEGEVVSATLLLKLPFGGLIFGKGPGDPTMGPIDPDPFETFQLSAIPDLGPYVTDPDLTSAEKQAIFDSIPGVSIAPGYDFIEGEPAPDVVAIDLDPTGLGFLNARAGTEIVLTGWMPTWSYDDRLAPGSSSFFEASELIFGLTDVHTGLVPKPKLVLDVVPVPEPTMALVALGGLLLSRRRKN